MGPCRYYWLLLLLQLQSVSAARNQAPPPLGLVPGQYEDGATAARGITTLSYILCSISNLQVTEGGAGMEVRWEWSGPEVTFRVEWLDPASNMNRSAEVEENSFTILNPPTAGQVCVTAHLETCSDKACYSLSDSGGDNLGLIIGLSVGVPAAVVVVVVGVICCCGRRRRRTQTEKETDTQTVTIQMVSNKSMEELREEFRALGGQLHQASAREITLAHRHPDKNRYRDVLPYDNTLVRVRGVDYINASHVLERFIAAQDPYPNQDDDFWQLIWEHDVRVILRLSTDSTSQAVAKYVPEEGGANSWVMGHDEVTVTLVNKQYNDNFYQRTLIVSKDTTERVIEHFHMSRWAKGSVPSEEQLLSVVTAARQAHRNLPLRNTPVLIHCGAGAGRTGTVIAVWHLIECHLTNKGKTLKKTVQEMRNCRVSMVQTEEQYLRAYQCLQEFKRDPNRWHGPAELYEISG